MLSLKSSGHSRGNGHKIIIFSMGFGSTKKKRVLSNEILLSHEILCPFHPKITVIAVSGVITITILLVHWEMVSELSNPWYLKASICNLVHDKTLNISGCE